MDKKKISMLMVVITLFVVNVIAQQQTGSIKGRIITADNKPAEGVTILIKNTERNAIADNDGKFELRIVPTGTYTLLVSLIGHQDAAQEITVESGKINTVSFKLDVSNKDLNEVVVTANKNSFKTNRLSSSLRLQSPILEIPQNIQVVTAKTIANQQIYDMLEGVTRNVSGATRVEHWDNYARITMRGSNVGAFRNGMNLSTTWGPLTEDMSMVERIEFVKGPAGFMLANGDPSGFYNVVTKKPTGTTRGEVNVSMGSFDLYRAAVDLDGKLTKDGKLLYRLNIMGQQKGSFRTFDFNNRYTFAPVLKYLIDDNTSMTLEYTHQYSEVNCIGSNDLFTKRGYADQPRSNTISEANIAPSKINEKSLLAIFNHKINKDWKFTAQLNYVNHQQVGSSLWVASFKPGTTDSIQRSLGIWDVLGLTKMGQMYFNGEAHTGTVSHKILAGVDMSNKEFYHDFAQGGNLGGWFNVYAPVYGLATPPVFDRSKNIRERGVRYYNSYAGFYAQDELGFLDNKLRVTLAGRYTTLKAGDAYNGASKNSKFTPRIGVSYSVDKNTAVYFVRDQSFIENYGSDFTGKAFDPLTGTNVELGIKKDWMDGKWNSTLAVYQITRDNVLTADLDHPNYNPGTTTPNGNFFSKQNGQQQTKGVEVDIKGQIVKGLDVVINYAYTNSKTTKDSKPENVGIQVPGSTRHIQNMWLNYKIDGGKLSGLGFSLGYQYQVKRSSWYNFDGTNASLPDYFRLDGGITYQKEKISYNLVINNILNKYLFSGAPYPYGGYSYYQAEAGTNARFSVSYRF